MVLLHTTPPISPPTYCMEYARMASVEELDYSLGMLSNYSQMTCKARSQQTCGTAGYIGMTVMSSSETGLSGQNNPIGALITPPGTPETVQANAYHRWSTSSASSTSPKSSISTQQSLSPPYTYQSASSSTSSSMDSSETSDKLHPKTPTNTPAANLDFAQIMRTATSAAATGANVVAIDNKIEQAMDLVKTHLTFAVREEVEILRSTIVELEAKVAQLESQNQVLKQFAPLEVVNSLAVLVQQHQQRLLQQQQLHSATATSNPTQPVQNAPLAAQNPHQSMPVLAAEVSTPPTSLPSSASVGMQTEVQHVIEQKQQQSVVPGTMVESEKKQ